MGYFLSILYPLNPHGAWYVVETQNNEILDLIE